MDETGKLRGVAPITPAAIVLPPGLFGIDGAYVAGHRDQVFGIAAPDACHVKLREFASLVYAPQNRRLGGDAHNLTPSPWIGCFDVLSAEAPRRLMSGYEVVVFLDADQSQRTNVEGPQVLVYTGPDDVRPCLEAVGRALPFRIEGEVGCIQARTPDGFLVGLFNNLGVTKTEKGETQDPKATRMVTMWGPCAGRAIVTGAEYVLTAQDSAVTLELPAGAVAVLSFTQP
ncbi:MAG: hypothetical protein GY851_28400 [bacterium]|nr:hypothetical protein [bacterium]